MNENQENRVNPDEILAQMAQDVPEMPADFHARWTEQIRAEAAGSRKADRRQESRRQWRYFLSAAPLNLGGCDGSPCRATLIRE